MKKIFRYILIPLFILGIFSVPLVCSAVTGIQISPLTFNYEIKKGESKTGKILVTNRNDSPLTYKMETEQFNGTDEDGAPIFTPVEPTGITDLKDWISFPKDTEGIIAPHLDKEIPFVVNVPINATPGGHYAAIFAREITKTPEGQTAVGVASRVGTLVLVSIPGPVTKTAEITSFTPPKFVWKGPIDFILKIKNTGTVHYDSEAKIELKPALLGNTQTIDLGKHTLVPTSTRLYSGTWNKRFPFGYYTVTASTKDGNGKDITTATTLLAIPLEIVIPAIILLIIIIVLIGYIRRHVRFVSKEQQSTRFP